MAVDERTYVAKVASWIDAILERRRDLPYAEAFVEETAPGGQKRADLRILRRGSDEVVLSGEVKMPDKPYGKNIYDSELLDDAFNKAWRIGAPYCFTWNVNEFALFKAQKQGVPYTERREWHQRVTGIRDGDEVWEDRPQEDVKRFWEELLDRLQRLEQGVEELPSLPLDERFIRRLEYALEEPLVRTKAGLEREWRGNEEFRARLREWMVEVGWEVVETEQHMRPALERAARLSCYALANRLVFYEVMRRRFPSLLPLATVGQYRSGADLRVAIEARLREAMRESGDYETIFEAAGIGAELPFVADEAVEAWLRFVREIEEFDFTRLDYDIIGRMYERLIGHNERRKYGQFYTSPDVVDLINAFCIRDADAKVLDPACGGGTFLVRAYARKRALALLEGREPAHRELLEQTYGVDKELFPAQLSTINLAVRHLGEEANYPQVVRSDFFHVRPGVAMARRPVAAWQGDARDVSVQELDAVVGNPPYVRQEGLSSQYKAALQELVRGEYTGARKPNLSGRSDLYAYFFPHAGALLREGGYLGLVTSIGWLDTEYGFRVQEFLLSNFRIVAVIESLVEKWFEDARVTTAVTILQKEPDEAKRTANNVRFIQLRKPLRDIYGWKLKGPISEENEPARQRDLTAVRELIEEVNENEANEYWRVRVLAQGDLWRRGCEARVRADDEEEAAGRYRAGKWGQYLRAPDVYFELLDRCGGRMAPVYELAEVKRGFTSGIDKFFCVRDVTEEEVERAGGADGFHDKWGIGPEDTKRVRVVQDGEGGRHLVEARYLEPEFHSSMEATRIVVRAGDVKRLVINAPVARARLRDTHLGKYVAFAEGRGWHAGSTVASRAKVRGWYDLGLAPKGKRAQMFWPKAQQYRHCVLWNEGGMECKDRLYGVWVSGGAQARILWAVLNSTLVALSKSVFGRPAGIEGNLDTEVVDVKMMLAPDPRAGSPGARERVAAAAEALSTRTLARMLSDEFEMADRMELDDAVLELMGIEDAGERAELRGRIYSALREMQRATREREVIAQRDRARAARSGRTTAAEMADDIWDSEQGRLSLLEFPGDFVRDWKGATTFDLHQGEVEVGQAMIATGRHLAAGTIRVGGPTGDVFDAGGVGRARFLAAAAACGSYGPVRVPVETEAMQAAQEFERYRAGLRRHFGEMAAQRTRDERRQKAIVDALLRRALQWRRGGG